MCLLINECKSFSFDCSILVISLNEKKVILKTAGFLEYFLPESVIIE